MKPQRTYEEFLAGFKGGAQDDPHNLMRRVKLLETERIRLLNVSRLAKAKGVRFSAGDCVYFNSATRKCTPAAKDDQKEET